MNQKCTFDSENYHQLQVYRTFSLLLLIVLFQSHQPLFQQQQADIELSGAGGDQTRAKRRVNIRLTFIWRTQTRLQWDAIVAGPVGSYLLQLIRTTLWCCIAACWCSSAPKWPKNINKCSIWWSKSPVSTRFPVSVQLSLPGKGNKPEKTTTTAQTDMKWAADIHGLQGMNHWWPFTAPRAG